MNYVRPSTRNNNLSHFKIFVGFCVAYAISDAQLNPHVICAFIEFLTGSYKCPATIKNIVSSVSSVRTWLGLPTDMFHDILVRQMFRAVDITLRYTPKQRVFLGYNQLVRIVQSSTILGVNCVLFRAFILLLFFSMARVSTLLPSGARNFDFTRNTAVGDLFFNGTGFYVKIKWAKNLQNSKDGYFLPILPNANLSICPVKALLDYLLGRKFLDRRSPLFILARKDKSCVPLSIRTANLMLRAVLAQAGLARNKITLHSFRRGACTAAYESGASMADIGSFGGWRSSALLRYLSEHRARTRVAQTLTFA